MNFFCNLQVLSLILLFKELSSKKYTIKQFKFLCSNFNTTKIRLENCYLKALRGRLGCVNMVAHYKGITDVSMTVKLFYRGTSGRYQPYFVDVDLDACDLLKYQSDNPIWQRIFKIFDEFDPSFRHGCPLVGPFNISMWEFDKEAEKFWPPVSPSSCCVDCSENFKLNFLHKNIYRGHFYALFPCSQ